MASVLNSHGLSADKYDILMRQNGFLSLDSGPSQLNHISRDKALVSETPGIYIKLKFKL